MFKLSEMKLLVSGLIIGLIPCVLEAFTDIGTFITDHFTLMTNSSGVGDGDNIAFKGIVLPLTAIGSILLTLGITYNWRTKTKSWVYKGSVMLFLSLIIFSALVFFWWILSVAHSGFGSF